MVSTHGLNKRKQGMSVLALAPTELARPMTADNVDAEDRRLVLQIVQARDAEAFERLYHGYRRRLGPFMYRMLQDPAAHEEVFNDVMLTVWRKAESYSGRSKVSTWIFAIAYRQCLKTLRGKREMFSLEGIPDEGLDESLPRENRNLVGAALARLTPEQRLAIELSYFQGNTYQEIAEIAQCPESTVKTRVFYARRKLKEIIEVLSSEAGARQGQKEEI